MTYPMAELRGFCSVRMYAVVGVAGVLGALSRFLLGQGFAMWWGWSSVTGTFVINMLGSFVLGWFLTRASQMDSIPPWFRVGFGTGFIGAFTTFSTFSVDTMKLLQSQQWLWAAANVLLSLWGGLLLAWFGSKLADRRGGWKQRRLT